MAERRDYYRILHVQRDAPAEVIRSSYRTMMQKLRMHPDLGGDHEDAALINEAFAVLNNADSRARYDAAIGPEREPAGPPVHDEPPGKESAQGSNPVDSNDHCPFCLAKCRPSQYREPNDVCGSCSGPLFPAGERHIESDSQRAIERIPRQTSAAFSVRGRQHSEQSGLVQDVSPQGMQLRTHADLERGQVLLVRTDVLDAVARVVDSRRMGDEACALWRVGLVFLTIRFHRARGSFISVDV
jgi:curved DNA-binding protein CbpA